MRTTVYLAIVCAILAVPTTLTIYSERGSFTRYEDVPRLFEGFSADRIAAIVVSKTELDDDGKPVEGQNGQPEKRILRLQKGVDGWMIAQGDIAGAPVRKSPDIIAENVLQHLESIRFDEEALVVANADDETLAEYGLDDDHGVLVQCFDASNQPVAELVKGDNARKAEAGDGSLRGFFVRRKAYKDVILYERDYWKLPLDPSQWVERQVLPRSAASELVEIEIQNERGTVAFKKDAKTDVEWQVVTGPDGVGPVRSGEVDAHASRIARAAVQDYVRMIPPDETRKRAYLEKFGLADPKLSARIKVEDGTEYVIRIGEKLTDKAEYNATFSNSNFHVTVADWVYTSFDFDPEDLFEPSPDSIRDEDEDDGETRGEDQGADDRELTTGRIDEHGDPISPIDDPPKGQPKDG